MVWVLTLVIQWSPDAGRTIRVECSAILLGHRPGRISLREPETPAVVAPTIPVHVCCVVIVSVIV